MSRKMTKAQSERVHFKRRLRERYGMHINRHEYRNIVNRVKSGMSSCILVQSNTRSVHRIPYKDREIIAVYDKQRGELITALPETLTAQEIESYTGD